MDARLLFAGVALLATGCVLPAERVAVPDDAGADAGGGVDGLGDSGVDTPGDSGADALGHSDAISDVGPGADVPPNAQSIRDRCVLLLHMNEPSWSGVPGEVIDDSGTGNNGTASGDATTVADGMIGRAGSFDGNGFVTVPNAPSLQPTTAFTIAAWMKPIMAEGFIPNAVIAKQTADGVNSAFSMYIENEEIFIGINGASCCNASGIFTNDSWAHMTLVFDGSQPMNKRVTIYLDGIFWEQRPATYTSLAPSTADLTIGAFPGGPTFTGLIDEVAIWSRALDQTEVTFLVDNGI
jgi:hypothetical protein